MDEGLLEQGEQSVHNDRDDNRSDRRDKEARDDLADSLVDNGLDQLRDLHLQLVLVAGALDEVLDLLEDVAAEKTEYLLGDALGRPAAPEGLHTRVDEHGLLEPVGVREVRLVFVELALPEGLDLDEGRLGDLGGGDHFEAGGED